MSAMQVLFKAVAAAGTAEPITAGDTPVSRALIRAAKQTGDNVGNVYIGDSGVNNTSDRQFVLAPNQTLTVPVTAGGMVNLGALYVNADNNGDGVYVMYQ